MKIAIIGTGIAGNVAARQLHRDHEITVFEANRRIGGHVHTHDIDWGGVRYRIDSGFIVFNYRTYPNFSGLLQELGVGAKPSHMGFSVRSDSRNIEYSGTGLNGLFAQRRNLMRPAFHRLWRDILRFNREAPEVLTHGCAEQGLGDYLAANGYSELFTTHYIIPMGSAIWSMNTSQMLRFPASYFIRFFHNHGLLSVRQQPKWYVVEGGSRAYVDKLVAPFRDRIHTGVAVEQIRRRPDGVTLRLADGQEAGFDHVFIATHSDQALRMLCEPTAAERSVLGSIPYTANEALLHTDTGLLPRSRHAWAAWNYHLRDRVGQPASVTYNMNILQTLRAPVTFCVTLNDSEAVHEEQVLARMTYHHPAYTRAAVQAQRRHGEVNGVNRTWYCGAYWGYGFHEDGMVSALEACRQFNESITNEQLHLRRAS